eukprot:EG_transcript_7699
MALSMVQQDRPPRLAACEAAEREKDETSQQLGQPDSDDEKAMKGKHVFHIQQLFPWLKMELATGEGCLAFLCGAPSSGKSEAARQTARQFGKLVYLVSNDLAMDKKYEMESGMKNGLTMIHVSRLDEFPVVVEAVVGHRAALICDDTNAHFCDFAAKVVLALGTGMPTRNIAWFVLDEGLPEEKEVALLFARQQQRFNHLWQGKKVGKLIHPSDRRVMPLDTIVHCVRQIRSTYFTAGSELVQWTDEFIACEMLKWAWSEVVAWDSVHKANRKVPPHITPAPSKKSCSHRPNGRGGPAKPTASLAPLLASASLAAQRLGAAASAGPGPPLPAAPGPPPDTDGGAEAGEGDAPLLDPIIESVVVSCVDEPPGPTPSEGQGTKPWPGPLPSRIHPPPRPGASWGQPQPILSPAVTQLGGLERRSGEPVPAPHCQTWTDAEVSHGVAGWEGRSPHTPPSQGWHALPLGAGTYSGSVGVLSPTASPVSLTPSAAPLSKSVTWYAGMRSPAVQFEALPQPVLHTHDAALRSPPGGGGDAPDVKPGLTLSSVLNGYLKAHQPPATPDFPPPRSPTP